MQRLLDRGADPEVPDVLEESKRKRGSFEDFKRRYQDVIGTFIYTYIYIYISMVLPYQSLALMLPLFSYTLICFLIMILSWYRNPV